MLRCSSYVGWSEGGRGAESNRSVIDREVLR